MAEQQGKQILHVVQFLIQVLAERRNLPNLPQEGSDANARCDGMSRWDPVERNADLWVRFGHCLRRARIIYRMTQQDLADELGVTRAAISAWERAVRFPDKNTILQLTAALFGNEGWYLE